MPGLPSASVAKLSFFSAPEFEGYTYKRNRFSGFLSAELEVTTYLSILLGVEVNSNLIADITRFPNYQVYLDTGLKLGLGKNSELSLLIRENPGPEAGTSDFSVMLGLNHRLTL